MNGVPLMNDGKKCATFRRVRSGDDMRSNVTAGGTVKRAKIDDVALNIADMVRPKLVMDGMFLVGLDIVGDKLVEINVFSPGGLGCAEELEETDFTRMVIDAMERKVRYASQGRRATENAIISML